MLVGADSLTAGVGDLEEALKVGAEEVGAAGCALGAGPSGVGEVEEIDAEEKKFLEGVVEFVLGGGVGEVLEEIFVDALNLTEPSVEGADDGEELIEADGGEGVDVFLREIVEAELGGEPLLRAGKAEEAATVIKDLGVVVRGELGAGAVGEATGGALEAIFKGPDVVIEEVIDGGDGEEIGLRGEGEEEVGGVEVGDGFGGAVEDFEALGLEGDALGEFIEAREIGGRDVGAGFGEAGDELIADEHGFDGVHGAREEFTRVGDSEAEGVEHGVPWVGL